MLNALNWLTHPVLIRTSAEQISELSKQPLPTAMLKLEPNLPSGTVALVCQGLSCQAPATSVKIMQQQIEQSRQN